VIAHLKARDNVPLPDVAYLVKIRFEELPPVTSHGWALYVSDQRIPKYWALQGRHLFQGVLIRISSSNTTASRSASP